MNIAFVCVLIAMLLPYVLTTIAKASSADYGGEANRDPRSWQDGLSGWRKRVHQAHLNGFEGFPPFASAVIIAHIAGAQQSRIDGLALIFIGARIAHAICYATDQARLRGLTWALAFLAVLGLFLSSF